MASGYYQVKLYEKDKHKATFATKQGFSNLLVYPLVYAIVLLHLSELFNFSFTDWRGQNAL